MTNDKCTGKGCWCNQGEWIDEKTEEIPRPANATGMVLASALIACAILVIGAVVGVVVKGRAEVARDASAEAGQ